MPVQPETAPSGPTLDLRVVVVPAVKPVPLEDPLVLLAGGPGQAATEAYGPMLRALSRIQQSRDLVFMDQRGTGSSAPMDCPNASDDTLATGFSDEVPVEDLIACRDQLLADGHDLTAHTTRHHTADLEALRSALGVEQWNLYGGSYGTRAALDYVDVHPDRVRRLILDGVAPRSMPLFGTFAVDGQAALDQLLADCAADTDGCAAAFPQLPDHLAQVISRDHTPIEVVHPRTGGPETVPLPGPVLAASLRNILYAPQMASLLPVALSRAAAEPPDLQPLITLASSISGGSGEQVLSLGMMISVACHEDIHRITDTHVAESTDTFLGPQLIDLARTWCPEWPVQPLEAPQPPVSWSGPTLLLSGALDPVTPPRWAEDAAQTLPDHHHLIAPGGGHIVFPYGCIPEQAHQFLDAPPNTPLDDPDCVNAIVRPPFALDFAGPPG